VFCFSASVWPVDHVSSSQVGKLLQLSDAHVARCFRHRCVESKAGPVHCVVEEAAGTCISDGAVLEELAGLGSETREERGVEERGKRGVEERG
jgi:hypothetical protein